MASGIYDIITVGGGLGGAALAKAMAEHGARVLVLEREERFRDRIRGEQMSLWGVSETQELGSFSRFNFSISRQSRSRNGPETAIPRL